MRKPKRPNGAGQIQANGYLRVTRGGRRVDEHILVAEAALGRPLPRGVVVHHVNEDGLDNRPENLVICTHSYHMLIHQRMRALDACGNANWRRCHYCGQYDAPENLYIRGTQVRHVACFNKYNRDRKEKAA